MKAKETLKKTWKENFKNVFDVDWVGSQWTPNVRGKMPKRAKISYKITNQKGAFGKRKQQPTFDPNETNKMRFNKRRDASLAKKSGKQSIIDGAKGLLTKVLGD